MGPGVLNGILRRLPKFEDKNLLVGFDTSDDACVYRIQNGMAMLQTVDFFPPMVDDPYAFGQIAAANAMSDIYAMGAAPSLAMNLLCVPNCLELDVVEQILAGGYSKVLEAGAVVAGGHTIEDAEPKYGLCVTGFADPRQVLTNSGAKPGDLLVLTKPIGSGVLATALKAELLGQAEVDYMVSVMAQLNRQARDAVAEIGGTHACTDVTGFGLLGHSYEMAAGSRVTLELSAGKIPLMEGARGFAEMGIVPGGAYANLEYLVDKIEFAPAVEQPIQDLLLDPQTSGGLLVSLPESRALRLVERLRGVTPCAQIIGRVLPFDSTFVRIIE